MFKYFLTLVFLSISVLASMEEVTKQKKFLIVGVAHRELTPFEGQRLNPILAGRAGHVEQGRQLYFFDQHNQDAKDPFFICGNFNNPVAMQSFAEEYRGQFDEIHFDWSVLKFVKPLSPGAQKETSAFYFFKAALKVGGVLYMPEPFPAMYVVTSETQALIDSAGEKLWTVGGREIAARDYPRQQAEYEKALERDLKEVGFLTIKRHTEEEIEGNPIFNDIRKNTKSQKAFIGKPGEVIDGFPVWIATK